MKPKLAYVILLVLVAHATSAFRLSAQDNSHVRIVRVSFAQGTVSIRRPDLSEWSEAPVNSPIQEGYQLATGKDSYAEVEFENGSTARVGENTLLEFRELSLAWSGSKVNRLELHEGYGTYHVTPLGGDIYEVKVGDITLTTDGRAEFRTDFDQETLRVEVFHGRVDVSGPGGTTKLTKDKVLEFQQASEQAYNITDGITKDSWDDWVAERDQVQAEEKPPSAYSSDAGSTNYGWSDLSSYGTWSYFSGLGYGWIPNTVGRGWSPFNFGRWAWYPTFGYTWISFEPWGWLPYHFGNWFVDPQAGWVWLPGAFGTWSPGAVVWYQGPGWVGWSPKPPAGWRWQQVCSQANGCLTAVPVNRFQAGKPVTPSSFWAVDSVGRVVSSPDIAPTRLAKLPGAPLPEAVVLGGVQNRAKAPTSGAGQSASAATPHAAFSRPAPTSIHAETSGSGHSTPALGAQSQGALSSQSAPRSGVRPSDAGRTSAPAFSGSSNPGSSGVGGSATSHSSGGPHH